MNQLICQTGVNSLDIYPTFCKTIPLIWDETLQGKLIYHENYPFFKEFLDCLPFENGFIQSAILINLPSGKSIPSHIDSKPFFKKYYVPFITNDDCLFTIGNETKHLKEGEIIFVDNEISCCVMNKGETDCIHLLIDFFSEPKLLVSTHNRLMWSDNTVIHMNNGVYYGIFDGDNSTVWVVSVNKTECLLQIDLNETTVLNTKVIPSRFTHDCIRHDDKVYIADCGNGNVIVLNYFSMEIHKVHKIFTVRNHINTLLYHENKLWCLLHNFGKSQLVGIDPETGKRLKIYNNVGMGSHGIVPWKHGFLILSSLEGKLLYVTDESTIILFTDSGRFLKGLCLYSNYIYFGSAPPMQRMNRSDLSIMCELVCVNLNTCQLVYRRELKTCGLLNSIALI